VQGSGSDNKSRPFDFLLVSKKLNLIVDTQQMSEVARNLQVR
jgi:hypothetical protein